MKISASILAANAARLAEEAKAVLDAGAHRIHFDVMDNHFVPNLSYGPMVLKALRDEGITAPIDAHLMTIPVDHMIHSFAKAGATSITFHPEASQHIDRSLQLIHDLGCQAGLAFNPATPLDCIPYVLGKLDQILIMSVNPGFSGQTFISTALNKIKEAKKMITGSKIQIAVDGGVNQENARDIIAAGATILVAGAAIYHHSNYAEAIKRFNLHQ